MQTSNRNALLLARSRAAVWHPCTQMKQHETLPLVPIARGQGCWLYDFDGRRYLAGAQDNGTLLGADDLGKDGWIWIFGGGLLRQQASIVATDGTVTSGPVPETKAVVGGFSVIEVPTREEALAWAARIAAGCRCAQEVREIMFDPES